jgi:hypothetical protein
MYDYSVQVLGRAGGVEGEGWAVSSVALDGTGALLSAFL